MNSKCYNFVSNLLYIFEKKENIVVERMNLYFILDINNQLQLFDIDKCLIQEVKKPKTQVKQSLYIHKLIPVLHRKTSTTTSIA